MTLKHCSCGATMTEYWFQYKHGRRTVQIRCKDCGKSTKPCHQISRAEKKWNKQ